MIYRPYGQTGTSVSAVGFGCMRFRDPKNVDECASLIKYAYDKGITYFDTAIGYGNSEELLGVAFKEMLRTRKDRPFYVSSKTFGATEKDVRKDLETSLTRMGLEHLDFYHVWCVLTPEAYRNRKQQGMLKAFEKVRDEGLVKNICVSTHMTGSEIGDLLADYPFAGVLLGYSAMNFAYRDEGLSAAARRTVGVVVMNPLGGGLIPEHRERFAFVKAREDETVVQGALRFLLNDQRITVVLVGFSTTDHVDEAVEAVDGFRPISDTETTRIRDSVKSAFNELCTGCRYCDHCPEGVPVPKMMDAYNHYLLKGDAGEVFNRLKFHWGIKEDSDLFDRCVECGQCEEQCTQKLRIIERLRWLREEAHRRRAQSASGKNTR